MKSKLIILLILILLINISGCASSNDCDKVETNYSNNSTSIVFGGHLTCATGIWVNKCNKDTTFELLNVLKEAGVDVIQFYIHPQEWKKHKQYYKDVAEKIREDNKKLYIGYQIGLSQNYKKYEDFNEYKNTQMEVTPDIIKELNPDYFSVVVEPITMEMRGEVDITDDQWIELVNQIGNEIKQINSSVKIVATTTAFENELDLFERLAELDIVDIVGINPYGEALINDEIVEVIDRIAIKKPIFFSEAWVSPSPVKFAQKVPNLEERKELEAQYLNIALDFAKEHGIQYICPFFSFQFLDYSTNPKNTLKSLNNNKRTELFYIYQDFIKGFC